MSVSLFLDTQTGQFKLSLGLNIGADKEAAEHFLSALSLQDTTNGDTSDQLWFTLRRAFLSMVSPHLLNAFGNLTIVTETIRPC